MLFFDPDPSVALSIAPHSRSLFRITITEEEGMIFLKRREGNAYLMTHSTHFIYGYMVSDHSKSDRENMLPQLHGLHFPISSKGYVICTVPKIG